MQGTRAHDGTGDTMGQGPSQGGQQSGVMVAIHTRQPHGDHQC